MSRAVVASLLLCLVSTSPAAAGRRAAVAEISTGIDPAGRSAAECRIENSYAPCGTVFWSLGQWCVADEVTTYFDLPNDPCLAGCIATNGEMKIESAQVGFRVVGDNCNGQYPVTTYPFEGQYFIYALDPALSTPECAFPAADSLCMSVVTTIPALTATGSGDPARSYDHTFVFGEPGQDCCLTMQPVFGGFRFISFSAPESLTTVCDGQSGCAWWYPGLRGRNGDIDENPCAAPCTQYFRNIELFGTDWFESSDAGLGRMTDFAHWLNVSCVDCPGTPVRKTTWGKLKSLMNR